MQEPTLSLSAPLIVSTLPPDQQQQQQEITPLSSPTLPPNKNRSKFRVVVFTVILATICLSLGVVIGVFAHSQFFQKGGGIAGGGSGGITPQGDKDRDRQYAANRPVYHVMPEKGWINDPNGLIVRDGVYHTFYQYNPVNNTWDWHINWGHAVSTDMVHWTNVEVALTPSSNGADCSGCWSGCMTIDEHDRPVIVYTGITKNTSKCYIPIAQQNWNYNDMIGFRETVMYALSNPLVNSPNLLSWSSRGILIQGPPQGDLLEGWRDPFVFQRGVDGKKWIILIGSGRMTPEMDGLGGTVMVYSAESLFSQWKFENYLLEGTPNDGLMWECPWMVEITQQVGISEHTHILGVGGSMWVKTHPQERRNPVLYYMGQFNQSSWKFENYIGPIKFDLGEIFYASNRMIDENGRVLIWGWLRECDQSPIHKRLPICDHQNYAGSLSIPRVISVDGDVMRQDPPEEIKQLRGKIISVQNTTQLVQNTFTVLNVDALHIEFEITLQRVDVNVVGLLFVRSDISMLLLYNWQITELRAIKSTMDILQGLDPNSPDPTLEQFYGNLEGMNDKNSITFRIFIDGSAVEIFTSSGQAMSLRLYHGLTAGAFSQVIQVISYNGGTNVVSGTAWNMSSIWDHQKHSENFARALKQFTF